MYGWSRPSGRRLSCCKDSGALAPETQNADSLRVNTQAEGPRPATTDIRTGRISDDDAAVGFWGNSTHRARWARVRDSLTGDRAGTEGTASRKIDAEVRV